VVLLQQQQIKVVSTECVDNQAAVGSAWLCLRACQSIEVVDAVDA